MRAHQRILLPTLGCIVALVGLSACGHRVAPYRAEFFVFGTTVEIQLLGIDQQRASAIVAQLHRTFRQQHEDWHAWKPGQLDRLNNVLANGGTATVDDDLIEVLRQARELEKRSGGHFNPAIGNLVRLWGFHTDLYPIRSPPPSANAIDTYLQAIPSMENLAFVGHTIRTDNPAVRIDLGGFAKGLAVDRALAVLRSERVPAALVNAGGDLRAYGKPRDHAWRVAVRHPVAGDILAIIDVAGDEAIFTSGNYARYKEFDGQRYAHILDPQTGYPVRRIASATVIHDNGAVADAATTALVVAGTDAWPEVAANMGIALVLLIDEEGCLHLNHAMEKRLFFPTPPTCRKLRALPTPSYGR